MTDISVSLRELAEPWSQRDGIQRAVERAARLAGLPYWRAFNIWYGKARRVESHEIEAVADALARKREEAARNELHELRLRLERLEALLAQRDPDFSRKGAGMVRSSVPGPVGPDSAVPAHPRSR